MTPVPDSVDGAAQPRRPSVSRVVSAALFAGILIAFALPFGTVSCEGPPVRFTGYELATSQVPETTPPATTDDGDNLKDEIESQTAVWALFALLAAVAGLVLGLLGRHGAGIAASVGLCAMFALFAAAFNTEANVEFEEGYVSASALFGLAAVWQGVVAIWRLRARRRASRVMRSAGSGTPAREGG